MNGTDVKEDAAYSSWIEWTPELERELFSPDEILDSRLMSRVMCALIDARREKRIGRQEHNRAASIAQAFLRLQWEPQTLLCGRL